MRGIVAIVRNGSKVAFLQEYHFQLLALKVLWRVE